MAQTIIIPVTSAFATASNVSGLGATVLFAETINHLTATEITAGNKLVVTSKFAPGDGVSVTLLADDSDTELQFEQSTGKFEKDNLIFGYAPLVEVKTDVRNYVFYPVDGTPTEGFFTGICNSSQSQDYTPALVANGRKILMISPAQALTLTK